jgi:ABC-2 type transport system ATP-binding protein
VDLRLDPGEILGIIGPADAGKTTLLRLLWGFLRPDEGQISVFGVQPHLNQVAVRLKAGYLSAHQQSCISRTVREHLRFVGNFYEGWDESKTDHLLEEFGLDPHASLQELFGGDRIKVGLISALGHRPSLLILDEPTSGLDPLSREQILHFLRRIAFREATSIVVSSDITDDLDYIADSILMLNHGRVVEYARAFTSA